MAAFIGPAMTVLLSPNEQGTSRARTSSQTCGPDYVRRVRAAIRSKDKVCLQGARDGRPEAAFTGVAQPCPLRPMGGRYHTPPQVATRNIFRPSFPLRLRPFFRLHYARANDVAD